MGWWENRVVPHLVEASCGGAEVAARRAEVCAGLEGRVLEIGFGSGLNCAHYPAAVTEVVAVEPNDRAWRMAAPRIADTRAAVVRSGLDGQRLEEPDASVDHALTTFTLCTIPDVQAALSEVRRVLRPGGRLHFLEHGRSPSPRVHRWQRRLAPLQRRVAGGCHLTRDPVQLMTGAGFDVEQLSTGYLPGPVINKPMAHLYSGRVVRRG
jgi:ubiquinone/menaquinone biosynthesis C-methylase UbiE